MLQVAADLHKLYTPSANKPMQIVVFGSGSGTNLEALLKKQKELAEVSESPSFEVKALFTDRLCRFQKIGEEHSIPVFYHSFAKFIKAQNIADPHDYQLRLRYDQENLNLLLKGSMEHHFSIDLIFLAGYMRLLYPPLVNFFKNKIINVHPADLTILDDAGNRKYIGANAVKDALLAGESRTRSSVILVNEQTDGGPILASGPWINYQDGFPLTDDKIQKHQNKQKILSDWPSCTKTIEYISQGRICIDDQNHTYFDGIRQRSSGIEII